MTEPATELPSEMSVVAKTARVADRLMARGRPDRRTDALMRLDRAIEELQGYIGCNRRAVSSFAKARAAGRRITECGLD